MNEILLFGIPITQMFLYFCWYSLLGWMMESTYCSVLEKHWINRGFLHLPLCPIYGVGVLIMINFFAPFTGNPLLFYVMATVVMSAWEYLVGWLLEVTTHMKYWDYSHKKFNLKGRICLSNCLWWGIASYLVIFWLHPLTERLLNRIPTLPRQIVAIVLGVAVLGDTVITIRQLALFSKAMAKAEEARVQLELGKKELQQQLAERKEELEQSIAEKRSELGAKADKVKQSLELTKLEAVREKAVAEAMKRSNRFMKHYASLSSRNYATSLAELRRRGTEKLKEKVKSKRGE
jgi:uncharacterized membrane protein